MDRPATAAVLRGVCPCWRGVCAPILGGEIEDRGVSLLTWGLKDPAEVRVGPLRFVPARAGIAQLLTLSLAEHREHPCWCGVYGLGLTGFAGCLGVSLLARGLPWVGSMRSGFGGSIPARAGYARVANQPRRM